MSDMRDQEFVEYVVKSIVDNPTAVSTQRTVDEMGVLITLTVDPTDLGQVIGRQGQTAKAIRTLLRVVGAKNQARVNLKINEPEGSRPPRMQREERAPREQREPHEPRMEQPQSNGGQNMSSGASSPASSAIDNLDI